MATPIVNPNLQADFDGYSSNLKNSSLEGERIISAGRAIGLAWELGQIKTAEAIWSKEVPAVAGMPTLAQFRAGYEKHPEAFAAFESGEGRDFTVAGTPFSNAVGSYARALEYASKAQEPSSEKSDGPAYWAGDWGAKALTAAAFPEQAAQLKQAIVSGVALKAEKSKGI